MSRGLNNLLISVTDGDNLFNALSNSGDSLDLGGNHQRTVDEVDIPFVQDQTRLLMMM